MPRFLLLFLTLVHSRHTLALQQTVLVTGATDGIGLTTAKNLAQRGYTVLLHGRDPKRIQRAQRIVEDFTGKHAIALPPFDLSTISGSRGLAKAVGVACDEHDLSLTCLLNNAGVYTDSHTITNDNLELTFAVNVVATFVITSLLLTRLLSSKESSRIVIASSISQSRAIRDWDDLVYANRPYSGHAAYSESKLMDAMLTIEFADRLGDRIRCNCLDPGTVNTKMLLAGWGPCGIDVKDALDQTWLCTTDEPTTGKYYVNRNDYPAVGAAYNLEERKRLWSLLSTLVPDCAQVWETL